MNGSHCTNHNRSHWIARQTEIFWRVKIWLAEAGIKKLIIYSPPYANLESRHSLSISPSSKHCVLLGVCNSPQNTLLALLSKVRLETWQVEYICFSWLLSCHRQIPFCRPKCIDRVLCVPIVTYVLRELCQPWFLYVTLDRDLVDLPCRILTCLQIIRYLAKFSLCRIIGHVGSKNPIIHGGKILKGIQQSPQPCPVRRQSPYAHISFRYCSWSIYYRHQLYTLVQTLFHYRRMSYLYSISDLRMTMRQMMHILTWIHY